jgi:hypothetical protein
VLLKILRFPETRICETTDELWRVINFMCGSIRIATKFIYSYVVHKFTTPQLVSIQFDVCLPVF